MTPQKIQIHATAVALDGAAVLLRGLSGSGKSDLAYRLMMSGAQLIGDDQVSLELRQGRIYADGVDSIRGLLEVRGVGLMKWQVAPPCPVALMLDMVARDDVPRLPDVAYDTVLGLRVPRFSLYPFEASSVYKVSSLLETVRNPQCVVR